MAQFASIARPADGIGSLQNVAVHLSSHGVVRTAEVWSSDVSCGHECGLTTIGPGGGLAKYARRTCGGGGKWPLIR